MSDKGYMRVCAASPLTQVADVERNTEIIIDTMQDAFDKKADMLVLPELCVSGYTCGDLFQQHLLMDASLKALENITEASGSMNGLLVWVGAPIRHRQALYNSAVAIADGQILAIVPKTYLPSYQEFYEKRWFASARTLPSGDTIRLKDSDIPIGADILIKHKGTLIGAEICEDLWTVVPPSCKAALAGAMIVANLSASDEVIGKHDYLVNLIVQQSARTRCGYVYASAGFGESTQDVVYSGNVIIAENGRLMASSPRFTTSPLCEMCDIDLQILAHDRTAGASFADAAEINLKDDFRIVDSASVQSRSGAGSDPADFMRYVDPYPFVPSDTTARDSRCAEIMAIQSEGLMRRLKATGCRAAVIGISGGLDSTLALLVTVEAFDRLGLDRKGIIGVTMPGFGTTQRTHTNADTIMKQLGITTREIPIVKAVRQHFSDIGHDEKIHDVTYENSQARERTQILMDIANQTGGMVIGTGDLSELALGWATYNGDHISMYGVNASIPKTLVRYLVAHRASQTSDKILHDALLDIIDTPISPELTPCDDQGNIKQKTEDLVGPYPLHDFFLYNMLRYGFAPDKIFDLAVKAFKGEYDRETIAHWIKVFYRRFFSQQFKRSCLPDGPKVGSVCLSPRGDWRMPSDATSRLWLASLDKIDTNKGR